MANKTIYWVIGSVLLAGAGVATYFYIKGNKKPEVPKGSPDIKSQLEAAPTPSTQQHQDGFPLMKGMKGDNVSRLQNALIALYGKGILPKYGADGDYGSETAAAVKKVFGREDNIDYQNLTYLEKLVKNNAMKASLPKIGFGIN